jgi:hypothetical protein
MTRTNSTEKDKILEEAGFLYEFNRDVYFNRYTKQIFSIEAIEDNSMDWLRTMIQDRNDTNDWVFYFNELPDADVKQEIIEAIQ